jgi:hypothetical protein
MSEAKEVESTRLVMLHVAKVGEGYVTGEFDRCLPPSLYTDRLEDAMMWSDEKDLHSFMANFEYKTGDYDVECYELHLHNLRSC